MGVATVAGEADPAGGTGDAEPWLGSDTLVDIELRSLAKPSFDDDIVVLVDDAAALPAVDTLVFFDADTTFLSSLNLGAGILSSLLLSLAAGIDFDEDSSGGCDDDTVGVAADPDVGLATKGSGAAAVEESGGETDMSAVVSSASLSPYASSSSSRLNSS